MVEKLRKLLCLCTYECKSDIFASVGKLISFLRMFFSNRPSRTTLKTKGIVKERVFGCDLGEHLLNSGQEGTSDSSATFD